MLLAAVSSGARSWYVDGLNGDDANDGLSATRAFRSVTRALYAIQGDGHGNHLIEVAPGLYDERLGERFPWRHLGEGTVALSGAGRDRVAVVLPPGATAIEFRSGYRQSAGLFVSGFSFTGDATAALASVLSGDSRPDSFTFTGNRVEGVGALAITSGGAPYQLLRLNVSGNEFINSGIVIRLGSGASTLDGAIENNLFRGSRIVVDGSALDAVVPVDAGRIVNNTFVEDSQLLLDSPGVTLYELSLCNNIFYGNQLPVSDPWAIMPRLQSNVFFANRAHYKSYDRGYLGRAEDINRLRNASGNRVTDPRFVDPIAHDYRLAAGSPCIDTGFDDAGMPTTDFEGEVRPRDGDGDGVARRDVGFDEVSAVAGRLMRYQGVRHLQPVLPMLGSVLPLNPEPSPYGSLYVPLFMDGAVDPDEQVLSDRSRPLVIYQMEGSEKLVLSKTADGRLRISF
jgi:hypothetical protein